MNTKSVYERLKVLLSDTDNNRPSRWTDDELRYWLEDGLAEIMTFKPEAFALYETLTLDPGSKQDVDVGIYRILDVYQNVGDNDVPGEVITFIKRDQLDNAFRDWHREDPSEVIEQLAYDPMMPSIFHVYPPPFKSVKINVSTARFPKIIEKEDGTAPAEIITVTNDNNTSRPFSLEYRTPLVDYMAYRAYSKNATIANQALAEKFYARFVRFLGGKDEADLMTTEKAS